MATAAVAQKPAAPTTEQPPARRFQIPDLERHGRWIVGRLLKAFPHKSERELMGWLRGLVYANECMFLYQEHSVALATVTRTHLLLPPHVQEIFVFAQEGYVEEAARFYADFERWARHQGIATVVVEELSDVPHEMIREKMGRLLTRTINFARL
jgi:hypothetical protein